MAAILKDKQSSDAMAQEITVPTVTETPKSQHGGGGSSGGRVATGGGEGFFHIYKTGQGYWTRMLTALGSGLLILGTVAFLYQQMRTLSWFKKPTGEVRGGMIASILAVVAGAMALLAW